MIDYHAAQYWSISARRRPGARAPTVSPGPVLLSRPIHSRAGEAFPASRSPEQRHHLLFLHLLWGHGATGRGGAVVCSGKGGGWALACPSAPRGPGHRPEPLAPT